MWKRLIAAPHDLVDRRPARIPLSDRTALLVRHLREIRQRHGLRDHGAIVDASRPRADLTWRIELHTQWGNRRSGMSGCHRMACDTALLDDVLYVSKRHHG